MGSLASPELLTENGAISGAPKPLFLYSLLSARACTVGQLIDMVNGLPPDWVLPVAAQLSDALNSDGNQSRARRRQLVILAALLNRVVFEIEGVPKDRNQRV